ncbi:uncharacterized protein LOC123888413 isoform X2 [Trifolium pratense]|uniref:uncharacterized protein LOC123888413 isoform X2 n=1 Tax=Trifolium pratense TaxID=57577 RepID=UPI001E692357|nr:uncharacterized protein LOC123888413 isoform X2 [Trifolium pratense]
MIWSKSSEKKSSHHRLHNLRHRVPAPLISISKNQKYWKENDGSDIGHNVFTNEEERAVVINFLKNREVAREESFMEVVSKTKKKNLQKGFQVYVELRSLRIETMKKR